MSIGHSTRNWCIRALAAAALASAFAACGSDSDSTSLASTTVVVPADASWVDDAPAGDASEADVEAAAPITCPPASVDYVSGGWLPRKPPRDTTSSCTGTQTSDIIDACEMGVGTCGTYAGSPCFVCMYSRDTDATYGFRTYVAALKSERLNYRGYALRTGAPATCADALEDYAGCMVWACTCSSTKRPNCLLKATTTTCAQRSTAAASSCQGHPAETFLRPVIEADSLTHSEAVAFAKAFCGP